MLRLSMQRRSGTAHAAGAVLALVILTTAALAHVGSPDVYYEGDAGPYHLLVTVRPPGMIPGVARVEIRSNAPLSHIQVTPVYITGKDQGLPPTPDAMQPTPGDSQYYTGSVWLMASGSWEVLIEADGQNGTGKLAVPVAAFARRTLPMQRALGGLLLGLMLFLSVGIVAIAGAATREGLLEPGEQSSSANRRWGRVAMAVAAVLVTAILYLGNAWWNLDAADLKHSMLYSPPPLTPSLVDGNHLVLKIGDSYWHDLRKKSWAMDFVPDHGHLMHLFLLRIPAMDRFYHLHPEQVADGSFAMDLPAAEPGHYKLFADVVRASGFPDTMVAELDVPSLSGKPLSGADDSYSPAPPIESATARSFPLPDGGRMVWEQVDPPLTTGQMQWFRFRIEDAAGKPVTDLELYMGMAGHAVFVRSDESVFAHIHPAGSVPMAALAIAQQSTGGDMVGMQHHAALPAVVSFPYGFPQPGDYRLFVQVKRAGKIETGVFDTHVN
jgi:hypothetical protein